MRLSRLCCRANATAGLLLALAACAAGADDGVPTGVRLTAGEPLVLLHPPIDRSIGNPVYCLTFVNDGAVLATGAASGVLLWNVSTGELRQTLEVDDRGVDSLVVAPRGKRLVAGGAAGVIKVWDAQTFQPLRTMDTTAGAVLGLAISPDGKQLASVSPNGPLDQTEAPLSILLWDLTSGRKLRSIPHPTPEFGATTLAFLSDGEQLATAQDRTIRVLDVERGQELRAIELPELPRTIGGIALDAAGRRMATGAFEPRLRLWDTQSWRQLLAWNAHDQLPTPERGVSAVGFSPDGRCVLSGGMDGKVGVWEAATGRRLLELDGRGYVSGRWITGVAMSPDGRFLAASHFGGTATIWRITAAN